MNTCDAGQRPRFYTSLGHKDDFQRSEFRTLLGNALRWCAGLDALSGK